VSDARQVAYERALNCGLRALCFIRGELTEEGERLNEHLWSICCCCWDSRGAAAAQFAGEQDEEAFIYKTRQSVVVLFARQTVREQLSYGVTTSEAHLSLYGGG
jgi:hypothetical protein